MLANPGDELEVVGGALSGGIIVRAQVETNSLELPERLTKTSIVRVTECVGDRILYELVEGQGPKCGWVSLHFKGKQLLVHAPKNEGVNVLITDLEPEEEFHLETVPHEMSTSSEGLLKNETLSDSTQDLDDDDRYDLHNRISTPDTVGTNKELADEEEEEEEEQEEEAEEEEEGEEEDEEEEEEETTFCCISPKHEECMTERKVLDEKSKDKTWKAEEKLMLLPHVSLTDGLSCLVLDEDANCIKVMPTEDPEASINLEYLSIALKARYEYNCEPCFSCEPAEDTTVGTNSAEWLQVACFEPAWLAETSAGDVLLKANSHFKDMLTGNCEQPVSGMQSCMEYAEESRVGTEWLARSWFVVRHAEVRIAENNALIPDVGMAVEVREQVVGENGLIETPTTSSTHPLLRYAAEFTRNFDLIAETDRTMYDLQEVAKAVVLARYLLERCVLIGESWLPTVEMPTSQREFSAASCGTVDLIKNSIYGGVKFRLEQFQLGAQEAPNVSFTGMQSSPFLGCMGLAGMPSRRRRPSALIGIVQGVLAPAAASTTVPGTTRGRLRPVGVTGIVQDGLQGYRQQAMTQLTSLRRAVSPTARAPRSMVTATTAPSGSVVFGRLRPSAAIGAMQTGVCIGRLRPSAALRSNISPSAVFGSMVSDVSETASSPVDVVDDQIIGVQMGRLRPPAFLGQVGASIRFSTEQQASFSGLSRVAPPRLLMRVSSSAASNLRSAASGSAVVPDPSVHAFPAGIKTHALRPSAAIGAMQIGSLGPMHRQRAVKHITGLARSTSSEPPSSDSSAFLLSGIARSESPMARTPVSLGRARSAATIGGVPSLIPAGPFKPASTLSDMARAEADPGTSEGRARPSAAIRAMLVGSPITTDHSLAAVGRMRAIPASYALPTRAGTGHGPINDSLTTTVSAFTTSEASFRLRPSAAVGAVQAGVPLMSRFRAGVSLKGLQLQPSMVALSGMARVGESAAPSTAMAFTQAFGTALSTSSISLQRIRPAGAISAVQREASTGPVRRSALRQLIGTARSVPAAAGHSTIEETDAAVALPPSLRTSISRDYSLSAARSSGLSAGQSRPLRTLSAHVSPSALIGTMRAGDGDGQPPATVEEAELHTGAATEQRARGRGVMRLAGLARSVSPVASPLESVQPRLARSASPIARGPFSIRHLRQARVPRGALPRVGPVARPPQPLVTRVFGQHGAPRTMETLPLRPASPRFRMRPTAMLSRRDPAS